MNEINCNDLIKGSKKDLYKVIYIVATLSTIVNSYFIPVCSLVNTITPRCCGRPAALLHEKASCNSASGNP